MIFSLIISAVMFFLGIYSKSHKDELGAYVFLILGIVNLISWVSEYVTERIKKHIDKTLKQHDNDSTSK